MKENEDPSNRHSVESSNNLLIVHTTRSRSMCGFSVVTPCNYMTSLVREGGSTRGQHSHFLSATGGVEEGEGWVGRWLGLSRREHLWSSSLLPWKRDSRSKKPSSPMVSCDPSYGVETSRKKNEWKEAV